MRHRQAIAFLSLAGLFVALYLWLYKVGLIGSLTCGTGGCELVQTSRYAVFLGVPVALYGVLGYALLLGVSLAGLGTRWVTRPEPTWALVTLATGGLVFTVYLNYLTVFRIHALCRWCVASAAIITAIWVVAALAWKRERGAGSGT
ncbi:MAG: vitamin K epoxide reductase family protein [Gemmatimonadales bacterium]